MMERVVSPPERFWPDGARAGGWWHTDADGERIVCDLCPRACILRPGDRGFCFVRENRDGQMALSTYGRSTGFCIDPIEKKPLNHFLPGTSVLSFGTAGCNLGCKFCQNWDISKSREIERLSERADPETIARAARQLGCASVAFTYNDPVVWAEYACDTARACREQGVRTVAVTAGYVTAEARPTFFADIDAANVDLKGFSEAFYQHYTLSHLAPVLETIEWLHRETPVWVELTNLIIPQANDGPQELAAMCDWILDHVGDEVPVHFTAFHPDFRLRDRPPTPPETLLAAWQQARERGLKHVYVGNVHDLRHQSTFCPACGGLLIERDWYVLGAYHLRGNRCGHCQHPIAGVFADQPGSWGARRQPVRISQFATAPSARQSTADRVSDSTAAQASSSAVSAPRDGPLPLEVASTAGATSLPIVERPAEPADPAEPVASSASPPQRGATPEARAAWLTLAAYQLWQTVQQTSEVPGGPPNGSLRPWLEASCHGAFVSVKRAGRLRSCCGHLGQPMTVSEAIGRAAERTASDDPRFPPLAPAELPYLDLEVWLLQPPVPVREQGAERIAAVEIGRHGLQVARGTARGLLLPGVATDAGLSAEQFLDQVCLKAGLAPSAWREPDCQLFTFEGQVARGPLVQWLPAPPRPLGWGLRPEELQALSEYARTNVWAHLAGATPSYYLLGAPEANVNGVLACVRLADSTERIDGLRFSFRANLPLQGTLFGVCESLAAALRQRGVAPTRLEGAQFDLAVLVAPIPQGTVARPELGGWDARVRGCLVLERGRTALVFDRERTPDQLVGEAARLAQVMSPDEAAVYSLELLTMAPRIAVAQVPGGHRGPAVRAAAVAGRFYPGSSTAIERQLDEIFSGVDTSPTARRPWPALMLPHAGWTYSGRVAAQTLARVELPRQIVVIGPKHTALGVDFAVAPHQTWHLPGRHVASDPELAASLAARVRGWQLDSAAHQQEHAIEVELPLIAHLAPEARVVGVALGPASWELCERFAEDLAAWLAEQSEPPLLVISSDMNHFASDAENRRLDELALAALETLDPRHALAMIREHHISMCGVVPAVVVMEALRRLGRLHRTERVAYATSADATGDTSRVVGYAGMLFG